MPTFLDETGDSSVGPNCSPAFRLAAVWFETAAAAEECQRAIAALRARLGLSPRYEFKFTRIGHDNRLVFLETVAAFPFHFAACSVDKSPATHGTVLTKEVILRTVVGSVTDALREPYQIAEACKGSPLNEHVTADQTNDSRYLRELRTAFQALRSTLRPGTALVKKPKAGDSQKDELVQLADMVCGAVGKHLTGRGVYYKIIAAKCLRLEVVAGNERRGRPEPPAS